MGFRRVGVVAAEGRAATNPTYSFMVKGSVGVFGLGCCIVLGSKRRVLFPTETISREGFFLLENARPGVVCRRVNPFQCPCRPIEDQVCSRYVELGCRDGVTTLRRFYSDLSIPRLSRDTALLAFHHVCAAKEKG